MTNNTIPNVPRELLERVLNAGWGSETVNALDDLRDFLESAPSPAGVDGWDVAGDILEKLSAAQAIIDGLRGEVARLQRAEKNDAIAYKAALERQGELRAERDQQAQRIGELEGLLTAERAKVPLYEAVERACGDLPEGWRVELHMENGAAWIELYDAAGIEVENFPTNNERLDYTINDATDAALYAGKEGE